MVVVALASFAGLMCHCTLCWWWWLVSLFSLVVVALASFVGVMLGFVKFGQGRLRQIKIKVKFQLDQVEVAVYVEVHPQTLICA